MKKNNRKPFPPMPPDAPQFAPPPPRPRPPFCPPPIPSVLEGQSLYEAFNNLNDRVNTMSGVYNDVIAHCYEALHNLERAAEENGAYYGDGEVWVEEGYLPDENCTYKLIHKAVIDRHGEPIRVKLHLAYGNTTNSMVEQSIFSASQVESADKMFVAIPLSDNGWYGNAIFNHSPIKSAPAPELWTVGFTERGHMKVYSNGQSIDTMLRDTIVDAMGCSGVVILNGELTTDAYTENIPQRDEQTERVLMGQNYDSGEVIWLVTGNENNVNHAGITTKAAAEILRGYGCDIAVELCEGANAGATDKGSLLFVPQNNEVPQAYAFWYITRKYSYRDDYTRDVAKLYQLYGENFWYMYLNKLAIKDVRTDLTEITEKIEAETARAVQAETLLQENINSEVNRARQAEDWLQENINKEVERATAAEAENVELVTAETERAKAAEKEIRQSVADETERAEAAESQLKTDITDETTRAETAETNLQTNINAETERAEKAESFLQQNINKNANDIETLNNELDKEIHDRTEADTTLHTEILTETGLRTAADLTLQQNINAETATRAQAISDLDTKLTGQLNKIETKVTQLETDVSQIQTTMNSLTNQMSSLDATVATLHTTVSDMETTLNEVKKQNIETTTLVHSLEDTINQLTSNPELLPYIAKDNGTATGTTTFENINVTGDATAKHLNVTDSITVPMPTDNNEAASKEYVDNQIQGVQDDIANYVPLTGGTMSGSLAQTGTNKFTQEAEPSADSDLVNKKYFDTKYAESETGVDTAVAAERTRAETAEQSLQNSIDTIDDSVTTNTNDIADLSTQKVNKAGDTMTGELNMEANKVKSTATPTENEDLTNKQYVDTHIKSTTYTGTLSSIAMYATIMNISTGQISQQRITNNSNLPCELDIDSNNVITRFQLGTRQTAYKWGQFTQLENGTICLRIQVKLTFKPTNPISTFKTKALQGGFPLTISGEETSIQCFAYMFNRVSNYNGTPVEFDGEILRDFGGFASFLSHERYKFSTNANAFIDSVDLPITN